MKAGAANHPIIQKELDEVLAKGAMEPSFGGSLSGLIIICIYLLLRCLLSDISSSLFSVVIILSPMISRMLICIFLLLSIIIIFHVLFGTMHHINGRFYLLGWPHPLGFSQPSLNLSYFFAVTGFSVLLSLLDDILAWFDLSGQVRGIAHFCVLYWFALD